MTDTPMTPAREQFFQLGHLYAARVGWPEGRERFRFLCESVTTDAATGQPVAHGQHGRLRTADGQWIWTPNPRTHDDWKGGAWTDITDWSSLLAEVDRLRARVDEVERAYTFDTAALKKRVAELESATGTARAMHRKHADSEHCQYDDMTWPCPTVTALGDLSEAADLAEGLAGLDAMRADHPAPCRVPDSPDCTCPLTEEQARRIEWDRPETNTAHDCTLPLTRRLDCGHCPHEVCQDCDRCPHTCRCAQAD